MQHSHRSYKKKRKYSLKKERLLLFKLLWKEKNLHLLCSKIEIKQKPITRWWENLSNSTNKEIINSIIFTAFQKKTNKKSTRNRKLYYKLKFCTSKSSLQNCQINSPLYISNTAKLNKFLITFIKIWIKFPSATMITA